MFDFKNCDREELKEAFNETAQSMNVSGTIIEKDFWVCSVLKELFSIESLKNSLTFKGGTSLSKIYKSISRFSEDIDVSIDRKFLGFEGDKEPSNASSNKKAKNLIEDLGKECGEYVEKNFLYVLEDEFKKYFGDHDEWKLEIDPDDIDQQTVLFYYPSLFEANSAYVKKVVKIEIGAKSDHWPTSMKSIKSYAAERFSALDHDEDIEIRVLNSERTFWEKATILHKYAHFPEGKKVPARQSRHYYDFYCLLGTDAKSKALKNLDLLKKVTEHKRLFFRSGWASYDTAKKGTLRAIPEKRILDAMEKDYSAMSEMFFGEVPTWNEIVEALKEFESEFNRQTKGA